jgi:hypothetical protein
MTGDEFLYSPNGHFEIFGVTSALVIRLPLEPTFDPITKRVQPFEMRLNVDYRTVG